MNSKYFFPRTRSALVTLILIFSLQLNGQINFHYYSNFKLLKGNEATDIDSTWVNPDFDDSDWTTSQAPFFYGDDYANNIEDGYTGTELTDMHGNYSCIFLRSTFTINQLDIIRKLVFQVDFEDGYVLWINGVEVLSGNRPSEISAEAVASAEHSSGTPEKYRINTEYLNLHEGENTVAVLACNIFRWGSLDFFFDMSIEGQTEMAYLTDSIGVKFSHSSGFYDTIFNLTLSTEIANAKIIYTLDGTDPLISTSATTIPNNSNIIIDPSQTINRGETPSVVVRASALKEGVGGTKSDNRTYIFIEKVKQQSYPGYNWPEGYQNNQKLRYDVNSRNYKIHEALTSLPTISIIADHEDIFGSDFGIYANALNRGKNWERECSVELINPDGKEGFNIKAGVRIRGSKSRKGKNPKHAFHLFFRSKYGNNKLNYPLFGDQGVSSFDKLDLRCSQNYSWSGESSYHNTFIREVFARDAQKECKQPYTRSNYYHLYLNGMYWGVYQTQERADANWASDYLGGNKKDYDVIKAESDGNDGIIAVDGNLNKWKQIYDLTLEGFTENKNYFFLEGKDEEGNPMKNSEVLVDIDNLIDYMINIFYTGNIDGPLAKSFWNAKPENMYAITNRADKSKGFVFLVHDAERTLTIGGEEDFEGLLENRVDIGYNSSMYFMVEDDFNFFQPQLLHQKLSLNKEYRQRFFNRAWKSLGDGGIFGYEKNIQRLENRVAQIDQAIVAEIVRWGSYDEFFTKDRHWLLELDTIRTEYFPYRNEIVVDQLKERHLYTDVSTPQILINGEVIHNKYIYIDSKTTLTFKCDERDIYYTTNGDDIRMIRGGIIPSAKWAPSGFELTVNESMVLKLQSNTYGVWSAMNEISIIKEQTDFSDLKVTELNYFPTDSIVGTDTVKGKEFEFIEFRNISSDNSINLSGLVIDSAVYYQFPANVLLAPGRFYVIASNTEAFYSRYGMFPSGEYKRSLSNTGERIVIFDQDGESIIDFKYNDGSIWNEAANGNGASLTSAEKKPTGDPGVSSYWMSSSVLHGTPFGYDHLSTSIKQEEVLFGDNFEWDVYPNPTNDKIQIKDYGNSAETCKLTIYELNGVEVYRNSFKEQIEISLGGIGVGYGVYLISIETNEGITTKKVIYSPN